MLNEAWTCKITETEFFPSFSLSFTSKPKGSANYRRRSKKKMSRSEEKKALNGNLAFVPLVLLLKILGFHLEEDGMKNKIFRSLHTVSLVIVMLLASPFIEYNINGSVVVATITYINARCIYLTLIIIYIRTVFSRRKSLRGVFKCLNNIDLKLQTTFHIKIKDDDSKWFIRVMLLLLFIGAFCSFAFECFNNDKILFNVGQFVHASIVFILSVKILFYCMLCASIKLRFKALIKYLRDMKSSRDNDVDNGGVNGEKHGKIVVTTPAATIINISQLKEISLLYDEVLEIISLMNESFATLLSFSFGEIEWKIWWMLKQTRRNRWIMTRLKLLWQISSVCLRNWKGKRRKKIGKERYKLHSQGWNQPKSLPHRWSNSLEATVDVVVCSFHSISHSTYLRHDFCHSFQLPIEGY